MNKVILVGNLARDPEFQTTPTGVSLCRFSIAVQRRFSNAEGNREADFINVVAWRQTAEFVNKFFKKGSRIGIVGSLQSRSYDGNDGTKKFVTEVVADEAEFVGPKQDSTNEYTENKQEKTTSKPTLQPVEDDGLPF